ncbi:MAG: NAD(P)-dependent oxidoreductase [Candidatus Saccharimonadales bacterium]
MNIGIVGLGIMGRGMAQNFLKQGHNVLVWNRSAQVTKKLGSEGAIACASPQEVAHKAELVFEVTANDESSRAVWLGNGGILAGADESTTLVASATLSVGWIDELAKICTDKHHSLFDMTLTGGRIAAESGTLSLLVGGDKDKLDELRPTLEAISAKVFYFGRVGQGTRYKLLLNTLQAVHIVGFGEVMRIAEKSGMDLKAVSEALCDRPGGAITQISSNSYHNQPEPITFSVDWITKDLTYAKQFGDGENTPLLDNVLAAYQHIQKTGRGDKDWTNVNETDG